MRPTRGPIVGLCAVVAALAFGTHVGADNSDDAALCRAGGWRTLVDPATGTAFRNQGACVSYAAHGGVLGATSANVAVCESVGGTFGADDQTTVVWDAVLWTCNDFWTEPETVKQAFVDLALLAQTCMNDSPIPNTHVGELDDETHGSAFTCGLLEPFNA